MSIPKTVSTEIGGGSRLNRKPTLIAVGMIGLFLVGMMYAVTQRSNQRVANAEPESVFEFGTDAAPIDFLENAPDGLVGVNRNDIGEPPEDPGRQSGLDDRLAEWLENQQLAKLQRESQMRSAMEQRQIESYERALTASSRVDGFERREPVRDARAPEMIVPASARPENPMAAILAAAQRGGTGAQAPQGAEAASGLSGFLQSPEAQALMGELGLGAPPVTSGARSGTDTAAVERGSTFLGQHAAPGDVFVLTERARAPRSPYEIKTGAVISGAMISATNSDLPGDIVAQVTRPVYDSATGRFVLIPEGTKLFGRYDAYIALGQERLLIVWNRLVFPDGETLDIGGMQGYDARGLAGFADRVDTHFLRTLGNALLISLVNASGEALVASVDEPDSSVFSVNLAQDFSDTTSAAFNEYLRNRLRIKPTLEIRSGYRFNIIVSKDIDFDGPYRRGFAAYRAAQ